MLLIRLPNLMPIIKILFAEIAHRKGNFLLSLIAVVVAAMLFVASPTILAGYRDQTKAELDARQQEAHRQLADMQKKADVELKKMEDETRKLMVKLGFNLRIVHRDTDMTSLYADFVAKDMPYEYVQRLADSPTLTKVVHLVPALHGMITWEGRRRLLSGFAPEVTQSHLGVKKPMGYIITPGTVYLGHEAGIGHKIDETIEILGKKFRVAKILGTRGTKDDIMIAVNLKDAQQLLNKPAMVTEILALNCRCETVDALAEVQQQLAAILPEAKVTMMHSKLIVRTKQRELAKRVYNKRRSDLAADLAKRTEAILAGRQRSEQMLDQLWTVITPLVIAVSGAWVGLLTWSNVRERTAEIGLFRALGKGSAKIAALFLGKALILGLLGGAIGSVVGFALARSLAIGQMGISPELITLPRQEFLLALLGTPAIAALASYIPTLSAISQDPAVALRDA